jgi:uncharacterized membrane protein YhaH (DUF805 family)
MESLALFFSASGRIASKPFVLGAVVVYVVAFLSQFLLAAPLMTRGGLIAFILVQAAITWAWYALHAKRLRDTGRSITPAVALAILYALAVPLFLLVMAAAMTPAAPAAPTTAGDAQPRTIFDFILFLFILSVVFRDPGLGIFGTIILAVLILVMLPFLIALGFSIWLATRPSLPPQP